MTALLLALVTGCPEPKDTDTDIGTDVDTDVGTEPDTDVGTEPDTDTDTDSDTTPSLDCSVGPSPPGPVVHTAEWGRNPLVGTTISSTTVVSVNLLGDNGVVFDWWVRWCHDGTTSDITLDPMWDPPDFTDVSIAFADMRWSTQVDLPGLHEGVYLHRIALGEQQGELFWALHVDGPFSVDNR